MYYYLHGLIAMRDKENIIVEVNGLGYDVKVAHPEEFTIGETLFVYTVYIHNENEEYLIGFKTLREKNLFLALTSVKGIGPKIALTAVGSTSVDRLSKAIQNADEAFLVRLPGIGKKNASQIILDLRGKLALIESDNSFTLNHEMDIASQGLKAYGFKDKEIKEALSKIDDKNLKAEEYLALALKQLHK